MTEPFGTQAVAVLRPHGRRSAEADMLLVRDRLAGLADGGRPELTLADPEPTAAFSRRDTLLPGYERARDLLAARGLAPIIRPVGGHLAVYGDGALVVHLWASHGDPRAHIRERFSLLTGALAQGLRTLGVDARVGPVPGEYCDGEFSVNDAGRTKLVGTGQRIVRTGYLFSAVVMVHSAEVAREALVPAYRELGLALRPETVGCVADSAPGVTVEEVREQLVSALAGVLALGPSPNRRGTVATLPAPEPSQLHRRKVPS
jgi:octanoyl-[GcvH]:protein N-octanoyltransferase